MSTIRSTGAMRIAGAGLHGGRMCAITVSASIGETTLGIGDDRAPIESLLVRGDDRGSVLRLPSGHEVRTIEHLLAAIAGIGAFTGVRVDIEGDEIPLADGAAAVFFDALASVVPARPSIVGRRVTVARDAILAVDGARYAFSSTSTTSIVADVAFELERFGRPIAGSARWDGDKVAFRRDVAGARTFGSLRELGSLRSRGLAAYLPQGAVVALDSDDPAWSPRDPDEPIRHKLLDLIGDLGRLGAPFSGSLRAQRPSHRATHTALDRALAEGILRMT